MKKEYTDERHHHIVDYNRSYTSSLRQGKKHIHQLAKFMRWPQLETKFTVTFENTAMVVSLNN